MAAPFKLTADGYESQWQVNYLAPYLFTSCVLPLMLSTVSQQAWPDRVRVVNLSSELATAMGPKEILYHDVNMSDAHGPLATL